jgi:tripartite-type tricarboxylate transporter receptor subunit TctC
MKRILVFFFLLAITGCFCLDALAQTDYKAKLKDMKPKDYPSQPIELVVIAPPGGGMDVTARILAKYMEQYTGNRCVVVNRAGGAGLIGHTFLATQAKNDGYTIGILGNNFVTDDLLRAQGKWTYKDMEALAFINDDPVTWAAMSQGPLKGKSLKDVIDMAKQKPNSIKLAMSPDMHYQFLEEQVELVSGGKYVPVPFQGGKPGVVAMLGGHVDVATAFLPEYKSYLDSGEVRVLGTTDRGTFFPNVPTFNEVLGVDNIIWSMWRFAAVPKGIAKDRARYLEAAFDAVLRDPECIKEFKNMGSPIALKYMSAKQTSDELDRQYRIFKEFFTKSGRISK